MTSLRELEKAVIEAARLVEESGCEASRWADETPPVWDRCLDHSYVEDYPEDTERPELIRCGPCACHAALRSLDTFEGKTDE